MKKFIPYAHQSIDRNDIQEVIKVLKSDWLTQGPKIEEFEKAVAKYCGAKYAVAVSSGTSALHCAYIAAGLKPGDEAVTTPLTFAATSNMLVQCGVKPIFADVRRDTLNINPEEIEKKINNKTKAIVTVDFAGLPCDYNKILRIAKKHSLFLIEDACHALGARYNGKKVGSFADMTILSFHPAKNITTGEGGMVLTNDSDLYNKLKVARNHGIVKKPDNGKWYYEIENPYFNYRITDIQCALGLSQLKKISSFINKRRQLAAMYNKALGSNSNIVTPIGGVNAESAWHIYPIQVPEGSRREVFEYLQKKGIGVQVHYMPLNLQPFYKKKFGYKKGDFPNAEKYYQGAITLPLFPGLTREEFKYVVTCVTAAVKKFNNKEA